MAWPRFVAWIAAASAAVSDRTPCFGIQWYFTSLVSPGGVDPLVGVDAEALLVPVVRRDAARAEHQRHHVHATRASATMKSKPGCGVLPERHRVRLLRVDDVRELDGVADEEDRRGCCRPGPSCRPRCRTSRRNRGGRAPASEESRPPTTVENRMARSVRLPFSWNSFARVYVAIGSSPHGAVGLEVAVRRGAAGVDDALGHALAVEVADLLQELVVLQRGRATGADGALVLVVVDRVPLPVGQHLAVVALGRPWLATSVMSVPSRWVRMVRVMRDRPVGPRIVRRGRRHFSPRAARHRPQKTTSASSMTNPASSDGVRQAALPDDAVHVHGCRRSPGTPGGGGCRRPGSRTGPGGRPARCGAPARRR